MEEARTRIQETKMSMLHIRGHSSRIEGVVLIPELGKGDLSSQNEQDAETLVTFLTGHIPAVVYKKVFLKLFVYHFGKMKALAEGLYGGGNEIQQKR